MPRLTIIAGLAAVLAVGCASAPDAPAPTAPAAPDCRVARARGDVVALERASGELVVIGGVGLLRSADRGRTWRREALPAACRWHGAAEVEGRLVVSCVDPGPPSRLLVLDEPSDGVWAAPLEIERVDELVIDTNLQPLPDGSTVLLLATHVDRRDDLGDAVYEVRAHRSFDGGRSWAADGTVLTGRRGERLEDTRTVVLADGELLLGLELETAEGAPSSLLQLRSADGGETWSAPEVVWRGGDIEPGGYARFDDGELWLVVSSDELAGGGSYDRASILARRSFDGGRSWTAPEVLVDRADQLSFGGLVVAPDTVLLPSLRYWNDRRRTQLALYVVDRLGGGPARCAVEAVSRGAFEEGPGAQPTIR
jgi:hypothetical protein